MKTTHPCNSPSLPKLKLVSLAVLASLLTAPAQAFEFKSDTVTGSLDTTISAGVSWRVKDRDPALIGIANGGTRFSVNGDDGNLNYDTGINSTLIKATSDLDLNYQNFGLFVRGTAYYDFENENNDRERTPLSDSALELVGSDIKILDAFVSGSFTPNDKPVDVRIGNQVVSWGESTFIPNGINVINPVDVARLRSPGAELKEAFLPVPLVWVSAGVSDQVTVEGFYQWAWEKIKPDPNGSYFSGSDLVGRGATAAFLGFGSISDLTPVGFGARIPRGANREPDDGGEYGLALRWFTPGESEIGFYFVNYHSRLPLISATTGTLAGALGGDYAGSARYFLEYPEDIKLYGLSFSTDVGKTGVALQGELSYRQDVPLQIDDVELLFAALTPVVPALGAINQIGTFGFSTDIPGFIRENMWQGQVTGTKIFGHTWGADQLAIIGELGVTYFPSLPAKGVLRLEGPGTDLSGNPLAVLGGASPALQTDGFGDDFSMGYRIRARLTYNNVFANINLAPSIAFSHDVDGTTPSPVGNFVNNRKALSLALTATYQNTWSAEVRYTDFYGGGNFNLIHDRDFVSVVVKYSK